MRLFILFIISFSILSCASEQGNSISSDTPIRNIEVSEANKLLGNTNYVILDVRTPAEIAEGKIPDAIEIDYQADDFESQINKLDKKKRYVVYCRSGGRSAKTCKMMNAAGFENAINVTGGYESWKTLIK